MQDDEHRAGPATTEPARHFPTGDQLATILDGVADGVIVQDGAGRLVYANSAAARTLHYPSAEALLTAPPGTTLQRFAMLDQEGQPFPPQALPGRRALLGEPAPEALVSFRHQVTGEERWAVIRATLTHDGASGTPLAVSIIHDVTEQRRAEAAVREAEEQYRRIFEATSDGLVILDQEGIVVEANPAMCAMHGYTRAELVGRHRTTFIHPDFHVRLPNYLAHVQVGAPFRTQALNVRKDGTIFPVEVHGATLAYRGKPHVLGVVRDMTERAGAERRLEEQVAERTRELEVLYQADARLHRSLQLADVLQTLVTVATEILGADKSTVLVWDEAHEHLVAGAAIGFQPESVARMIHAPGEGITGLVALTGEPMAVADTTTDPRVAHRITDNEGITALIHVPLIVGGAVFGVFGVNYCRPHPVGAEEQRLLLSLAQRAALAIENAQLYAQAQATAALEERQRLARELHDSVSQALYGIALGARTARTLLDRDPSKSAAPLDYVLNLSQAGLAEMRALIFELRPESLSQEGLVAALEKQAAALRARHGLAVTTAFDPEPNTSPDVQEALYRIAQEALHNVVKHAGARQIELILRNEPAELILEVHDDGIGFDAGADFPGHLGLRSMRERATRLGGSLVITSAPGSGTHLTARLPRRAYSGRGSGPNA